MPINRRSRWENAFLRLRAGEQAGSWLVIPRVANPLPTPLERETLLVPAAIGESVVQEAERFLRARLPDDFAERLAAKAFHLYPRHKRFHKTLNRPGNRGRSSLYM